MGDIWSCNEVVLFCNDTFSVHFPCTQPEMSVTRCDQQKKFHYMYISIYKATTKIKLQKRKNCFNAETSTLFETTNKVAFLRICFHIPLHFESCSTLPNSLTKVADILTMRHVMWFVLTSEFRVFVLARQARIMNM